MLRRFAIAFGLLVGLVILVAAGAFGFAQTRLGRAQIEGLIERLLAAPGQSVEIGGLAGLLPFDIRLDHLRLRDPDGIWLEVEDARLHVRPAALIRGSVEVEEVGARRVALDRLPPPTDSTEPFSLPRLPELPSTLPRVKVNRLYVDTLAVGEFVLGQAATFSLTAQGGADAAGARMTAAARRTDQATARADLSADLDLAERRLRLDLRASETGGLLAAVTGRPEAGDLDLALTGDGLLADWRGRLTADAERLAALDLGVELAYAERWRLEVDGSLAAAPGALPAEFAGIVGPRADLALVAVETAPGLVRLERLRLAASALTASGEGEFDLARETVNATLALSAPDLAPFADLVAVPLAGAMELRLTATGEIAQPDLNVALEGDGIAVGPAGVGRLAGTVDLAIVDAAAPVLRAGGRITAEDVRVEGREIGDGRAELAFEGEVKDGREAQLRSLTLRSALGEVGGSGSLDLDLDRLAGAVRLDVRVPDLAKAATAAGGASSVTGAVVLGADITLGEGLREIAMAITGDATALAGLPPGGQELVGAAPSLVARLRVEPEARVSVESLALVGAGVRLEGDPRLGLPGQDLGGELRLSIPDLGPLQAALSQPVAGALDLKAALGGTLELPRITLDGSVDRLVVDSQAVDRVALAGDVAGPQEAPSGSVRLTATRQGQAITLSSNYRLGGDLLTLSALTVEAPTTRLAGGLDLALAGPLARGSLSGEIGDLGALEPWIGQKLAGSARIDLTLATPKDRQDVTLRLNAAGVAGEFGSLRQANLAASLSDLHGRGAVGAELTASGLAASGLALDRAKVSLGGRLAALEVTANAAGAQAGQPFDLTARATVEALAARRTIRLSRLDGTLAGEELRLAEPATLVLEGANVALDRLDLALGPARLSGSFALAGTQARGDLALARLPLAMLERFGAPALAGTGEARLTLGGTRRAPELALTANVAKAALDPAARASVDGRLDGRLSGGRLRADLSLTGLGAQPLTLSAGLPASLSLDPPTFTMAQNAGLSGSVAGPVDLAKVALLAALDGTQLAGVLTIGLDLSGTIASPRVAGAATLDGGSLQDLRSGVRLSQIGLSARAEGDRLTIERLTATDPTGGTLRGQGTARLLAGGNVGFDLTVEAARARLLDNAYGVVVLSGTTSTTGTLAGALARGNLTLDRGDFQIPDSVGPSVPTIEVTEVRGGEPVASTVAQAPPFDLAFDLALDVPGRLFVRGRGLDSEWGGNLTLKGDLADPLVEGELDVRRGRMDLLDRRFEIGRGLIEFVGSRPPVPMVDLAATATTAEITVTVTAQGPATDPTIALSSEPPLPQDEILARLLFGTSVARITPMQGLRLAAAINDLRGEGFVSSAFTRLRRAVGVDTLDLQSTETTDESGETSTDTTARVGKYVTDQVYIEAERGVTSGTNKARVKVDLTPNLSVGTTVDDQAQTGVGLQWRYDY